MEVAVGYRRWNRHGRRYGRCRRPAVELGRHLGEGGASQGQCEKRSHCVPEERRDTVIGVDVAKQKGLASRMVQDRIRYVVAGMKRPNPKSSDLSRSGCLYGH